MKTIFSTIVAAALFGAAATAGAATLVNGSFETGANPNPSFSTQIAGSTAITGWTVGGFGVDYIGDYWKAADGVRSIDLSAGSAGSVSQSFATVVGSAYTVLFDLSGNPDGGVGTRTAVVSIAGSLPGIRTYSVGSANSRDSMNWESFSYDFTAFDTVSTLVFASAEYSPFGPALDNVSAGLSGGGIGSSVPEPASWALMLIGFGMVGAAARRRSPMVVAA